MLKLEVFDPPMCCSTGICGASADPRLVNFASDLEWLKTRGIEVVRHGLSFEPTEFVKNEEVKNLLNKEGNSCLPILVVGMEIVSKGIYPSRDKLAHICKIAVNEEEAPPIHREENCCCGVDCDCGSTKIPEEISADIKCNCSNAPAEDNCFCGQEGDFHKPDSSDKIKKIIFVVFIVAKFWAKF